MKNILFLLAMITASIGFAQTKTEFTFKPDQSMCITGKGAGQDGAINPYYGSDSVAVVKNIGETAFSVRIKDEKGKITSTQLNAGDTKNFTLLKGAVLFVDSTKKAFADITFEEYSK